MSAQPEETQQANAWAKYEQRKAEIPEGLSGAEYEAECKRIADELGI